MAFVQFPESSRVWQTAAATGQRDADARTADPKQRSRKRDLESNLESPRSRIFCGHLTRQLRQSAAVECFCFEQAGYPVRTAARISNKLHSVTMMYGVNSFGSLHSGSTL